MTNLLAGVMIAVTVWSVMSTRTYIAEHRLEKQRADELLQRLLHAEGDNRVLTDQARYYKALSDKFLNQPVQALIQDEQLAQLAATITRGLASAVCKEGMN